MKARQIKVVRDDYNYKKFMELGRYQEIDSYPHPRLENREFVILERVLCKKASVRS